MCGHVSVPETNTRKSIQRRDRRVHNQYGSDCDPIKPRVGKKLYIGSNIVYVYPFAWDESGVETVVRQKLLLVSWVGVVDGYMSTWATHTVDLSYRFTLRA